MATTTANFGLLKPETPVDDNVWGPLLNTNADSIDAALAAAASAAAAAAVSAAAGAASISAHAARTDNPHATTAAQTTYTPAGTGAVARTMQDKAREEVSVLDFMASSRVVGTTDDQPAVLAALTYAAATGRRVRMPAGAYWFGARVVMPTGSHLVGELGTVVKPLPANVSSPLLFSGSNANDYTLEGLTLDGNVAGIASTNPLFQFFNAKRVTLRNLTVQNTRGIGLNLSSTIQKLTVSGCRFINVGAPNGTSGANRRQAIALTETVFGNSKQIAITNNLFETCGLDCVSLSNAIECVVSGNIAYDLGAAFLYVVDGSPCARLTIANNNIRPGLTTAAPPPNAIDLVGANDSTITGNTIFEAAGCGIGLFLGSRVSITGNTCINSHQNASGVHNAGIIVGCVGGISDSIVINGNVCTDTQATKTVSFGLMVATTATNVVIGASNILYGNAVNDISAYSAVGSTYTFLTNRAAPREIHGDGTPQGVVSAPVGSRYFRTDGGTGTTFYLKETGTTTSSGWVAK